MFLTRSQLALFAQATKKAVLDTLFPLRCLGCGRGGHWICRPCTSRIERRLDQECPLCRHHLTPLGAVCFSCRDSAPSALDGVFVVAHYHDPLMSRALHTYKYRFIPDLALPLGQLLIDSLSRSALPLPDVLIPVPLHPRRLRYRGFNQSALLARIIGEELAPGLALPVLDDVLLRTRFTKPQMKTESREERLENLRDAFALTPDQESLIKGRNIWLVDDVATTGTTLEECAQVLKSHGARSVWGIVLAR